MMMSWKFAELTLSGRPPSLVVFGEILLLPGWYILAATLVIYVLRLHPRLLLDTMKDGFFKAVMSNTLLMPH